MASRSFDASGRVVSTGDRVSRAELALTRSCTVYSIVSPEKKIVGIGYNGFPNGCDDDSLPWARSSESGSLLDTKYPVRSLLEPSKSISRGSPVCVPCRDECDSQQELDGCERMHCTHRLLLWRLDSELTLYVLADLCGALPMQRVREAHHSGKRFELKRSRACGLSELCRAASRASCTTRTNTTMSEQRLVALAAVAFCTQTRLGCFCSWKFVASRRMLDMAKVTPIRRCPPLVHNSREKIGGLSRSRTHSIGCRRRSS